jgi:hypothetical protein
MVTFGEKCFGLDAIRPRGVGEEYNNRHRA